MEETKYFLTFIIFGISNSVFGWRPYRIQHVNVTAYSVSEKMAINVSIANSEATTTYVEFKQTIHRPFARVEYYVDSGNGLFESKYINETIDVCRFFRDKTYLPLVQLIYGTMVDQANYPKSCPIRKKLYVGKNVKIDVEKLPPTLPEKMLLFGINLMSKEGSVMKPLVVYKIITKIVNIGKAAKRTLA